VGVEFGRQRALLAQEEIPAKAWALRLTTTPVIKGDFYSGQGRVMSLRNDTGWVAHDEAVLFTIPKSKVNSTLLIGSQLLVKARSFRLDPEHGHPADKLYFRRGFTSRLRVKHMQQVKFMDVKPSFTDSMLALRASVARVFVSQFRDSTLAAVATALVVGEELTLDKSLEQAYADTGTLHILCVSGMHVGLLYALIGFLTGFMRKSMLGRFVRYPLLFCAVWTYACIAGLAPSILRASVMFSFLLLNEWTGRKSSGLNALFSALFVLLAWYPAQLFEPGLQLSFLAVMGILVYQRPLIRVLPSSTWSLRRISEALSVTLSAQLLATPVSLGMFGRFPNYFLPANLLVVPHTTLCVYSCACQLLIPESFPWHHILVGLNTLMIEWGNQLVCWIASWPGALSFVQLSPSGVVCCYAFTACATRWIHEKRFFWLLLALCCLFIQTVLSLVMTS